MGNTIQRLFLVGCARSGTTLLQSLLAAHPEIVSFPESHFFRHLNPHATWRRRLGLARPTTREHLEEFYDKIGREDGVCVSPGPFTLRMKRYTRASIRTLDNKAVESGANYWLEKTPMHLHHIPLIERYVSNTQFIHLVRDGRDVVASMHKVTHEYPNEWGGERSIEECLRRWTGDIERTRRHAEKPEHHVVRYRDIAKAPGETLHLLCSALGVSHTEGMTEEYKEQADEVALGFEEWKGANTEDIRYKGHQKFNQYFDRENRMVIESDVSKYDLKSIATL